MAKLKQAIDFDAIDGEPVDSIMSMQQVEISVRQLKRMRSHAVRTFSSWKHLGIPVFETSFLGAQLEACFPDL